MAKRDKLTQKQKRQIAHKQNQRLKNKPSVPQLNDLSPPTTGLLISRFGEQADVLDLQTRQKHRCYLRQNLGAPVPGDNVIFRLASNDQGIVEAIEKRTSELCRPSAHQGLKPVVANISQVFVVVAPLPDFSSVVLDRYLVAINDANIDVIIIANKWDLVDEIKTQQIESQLAQYSQLDYPIIRLSALTAEGVAQLQLQAQAQRSILVGQSGVGKSSIINQLFPEQLSRVNQISENSRLGQHTTTASQLFLFDDSDGFIIDSPGIREFGLWHMDTQTIAQGFVEFQDYIGSCRFRDCKHLNEPGCRIIEAVEASKISKARWRNYCKIVSQPED